MKGHNIKASVSIALFVIASLLSFLTVFWGLDFRDTFYFGCKFVYGDSIDVFLPVVQGTYIVLSKVFGGRILAFRIFNWLLYFAACLLLLFYLEKTGRFKREKIALILSLAVFTIPWTSINVLNGNAFTTLGLVGLYVSMALFYEKGDRKWLVGVVAFLDLCFLARFPNVVVCVVLLVMTLLLYGTAKERLSLFLSLFLSLLLYVVVNSVLFGGVRLFIGELKASFMFSSEVSSANHSLNYLFSEYLHTLKDMVSDIKYLSVIVAIPIVGYFCGGKYKKKGIVAAFMFALALVLFVYFRVQVISDVVNYFLLVLFYSLIFILVFIAMVVSLLRKDWRAFGWSVLPVLLSVCAAAGSDSGLILMGGPLGIFCPYILFDTIEKIKSLDEKKMVVLLCSLFGLSVSSFFYVREGLLFVGLGLVILLLVWIACMKEKRLPSRINRIKIDGKKGGFCVSACAIFAVAMSVCLFVYAKMNRTFWDKPLYELNCMHDEERLKGVLTNTESRDYVNQVMSDYRNLPDGNVVFYGVNSMIFSYLTCANLIQGTDFLQDDASHNVKALANVIDDVSVLFLCPKNPVVGDFSIDNYPKLDSLLMSKGWRVEKKVDYAIYYASDTIH